MGEIVLFEHFIFGAQRNETIEHATKYHIMLSPVSGFDMRVERLLPSLPHRHHSGKCALNKNRHCLWRPPRGQRQSL